MADDVTIRGQFTAGGLTIEAEEGTEERRILSGVAVPYGVVGYPSIGGRRVPAMFLAGSLDDSLTPPVDRDHNPSKLIGVVRAAKGDPSALTAKVRVSKTAEGNDVMELAGDRALTGFSVTALPTAYAWQDIDGEKVLVVAKAEWEGLSVVSSPAFSAARIGSVAASLNPPTQKEPAVAENTLTIDAAAFAPITALVSQLEADRKADAERIAAAEKAEAEKAEVKRARMAKKVGTEIEAAGLTASELIDAASGGRTKKLDELTVDELDEMRGDIQAAAKPADIKVPAESVLKRKVFASAGEAARAILLAAKGEAAAIGKVKLAWEQSRITAASEDGNLSEVTTAEVPGLIPPVYTSDVLGNFNVVTPVLNTAYRHTPLPPAGMEIIKPRWDVLPDGDWYGAELTKPASNVVEIGTQTVSVLRYAHAIRTSMDVVERSAFGGFAQRYYDAVSVDYLSKKEAKATEVLVFNAHETTTAGDTTPQAEIATLIAAIVANQQDGDGNFRGLLPNYVAVAPDVYGTLMETTALNGFAFATGSLNYGDMQGTLAGLRIFMAPAMDAGGILVGNSAAAVAYDGNELQLRSVIVNTMGVELGVYAYTAFDVDYPDALACNFAASE